MARSIVFLACFFVLFSVRARVAFVAWVIFSWSQFVWVFVCPRPLPIPRPRVPFLNASSNFLVLRVVRRFGGRNSTLRTTNVSFLSIGTAQRCLSWDPVWAYPEGAMHSKFEFEVHHVSFCFGLVFFENCAFGQDMRASSRGAAALFVSAGMPVRTYRLARRLAPWHQPRRARDNWDLIDTVD